jgi:hypothetical protein
MYVISSCLDKPSPSTRLTRHPLLAPSAAVDDRFMTPAAGRSETIITAKAAVILNYFISSDSIRTPLF